MANLETKIAALQKKAGDRWLVLPYDEVTKRSKVSWLSPDAKLVNKFPELDDVKDEIKGYLPFGKVGRECLLVEPKAPHRVFVFMERLWPLAPSLDAFFGGVLLAKGDKAPAQRLEQERNRAIALEDKGKAKDGVKVLQEALANFQIDPDPKRDTVEDIEEYVCEAWNSLGVIAQTAGDYAVSEDAYRHAVAWGSALAAANMVELLCVTKRAKEAVAWGTRYLAEHGREISSEDAAEVRAQIKAATDLLK